MQREPDAGRQQLAPSGPADLKVIEALLEHSENLLAYLDRDFNFVRVNRAYAEASARRPEELIGRNHFELFPHPENEAIFTRSRDTGEPAVWREKPFVYSDLPERGVTYWDWTLTPLPGGSGQTEGLVLSLTDVTAQVLSRQRVEQSGAEEDLRRSEQEWELTFDTIPDLLAILDADFRILRVNRAMAERIGVAAQDCIGLPCYEVVHGLQAPPGSCPHLLCSQDQKQHAAEVYEPRLDGYFLVTTTPRLDPQGRFIGSVHVARDISGQKQTEKQLRDLALFPDQNPHPVLRIDREGTILYANHASDELLQVWGCRQGGQAPEFVGQIVTQALSGQPPPEVLFECGSQVLAFAVAPFAEGYANLYGHDVTERVHRDQERARQAAALAEVNEAKDLFFNTLSHELRTPLAAMLNAVEVMKLPGAGASRHGRMLSVLERSVRLQAQLIDDLLDLSRIMRGKVEIARDELDLRAIVSAQVEAIEGAAQSARLTVSLEQPAQPVPVVGDGARLGQVLSNIIGNAIKFTDPGGRIAVQVAAEQGQGVVRVRDSGVGMSALLLAQVFEPFRQGDTSLARSKGGLGIGLAVARSLAELHGGELAATSPGPGQGSEFSLRLPLDRSARAETAAAYLPAETLAQLRVLVVEDHPDLRGSIVMLLELLGQSVTAVEDGARALEIACQKALDVAFIDIGLPGMDGYELAQALRQGSATRHLHLIALTGYATPEHRERALRSGFDQHLAKPVDGAALQVALAEAACHQT